MPDLSDDVQIDLALRLLDDDEEVLGDILRVLGPQILAFLRAKYKTFNEHDLEDVLAVAIHKVWTRRNQYDDKEGSLRSWFFRIAENVLLDVVKSGWRKAKRRELDLGADHDMTTFPERPYAPDPDADDHPPKTESRAARDLKEIVASLPEAQRRIVTEDAYTRDGVASAERLSGELGIPAGTVRVYRCRAMERIRTEMRRRGHDVP